MKKVEKLVKILLIMVMMVAALLFADLVVLALMVAQTDEGLTTIPLEEISRQLQRTAGEDDNVHYSLSKQGMDIVDRFEGFVFLMEDTGNVVWSYHLPEELPLHYTVRQIVQFTRFLSGGLSRIYAHCGGWGAGGRTAAANSLEVSALFSDCNGGIAFENTAIAASCECGSAAAGASHTHTA